MLAPWTAVTDAWGSRKQSKAEYKSLSPSLPEFVLLSKYFLVHRSDSLSHAAWPAGRDFDAQFSKRKRHGRQMWLYLSRRRYWKHNKCGILVYSIACVALTSLLTCNWASVSPSKFCNSASLLWALLSYKKKKHRSDRLRTGVFIRTKKLFVYNIIKMNPRQIIQIVVEYVQRQG